MHRLAQGLADRPAERLVPREADVGGEQAQAPDGAGARLDLVGDGPREHLVPAADAQHRRAGGRGPRDGVGQAGLSQPPEVGDRGTCPRQDNEVGVGQLLGPGRVPDEHAGLGGQRVEVGEVRQAGQPRHRDPQDVVAHRLPPGAAGRRQPERVLDVELEPAQPRQHAQRRPPGQPGELVQSGGEQADVAAELVHQEARDEPLVGRRHQRHGSVERREEAAAVDVAHDHHREVRRGGQAHVGDVVGAQVDLRRGAGPLADDHVEARPQVGQALQHLREQRRLQRAVAQRGDVGDRLPQDDHLAVVFAAGLQEDRVHRRLGGHPGGGGLHDLGAADLRPVGRDHRVVAHVLRLERRHRYPLARQPPADPGGDHRLPGVRGRAGDEQGAAHARGPTSARGPASARCPASRPATASTAVAHHTTRESRTARRM